MRTCLPTARLIEILHHAREAGAHRGRRQVAPSARVSGLVISIAAVLVALGAPATSWASALASSATDHSARGAGPAPALIVTDSVADFHWTGHVDASSWVRVRNLTGWVHVERTTGADVEIRGHKRWRSGDSDSARIVLTRSGSDVLVCALWGDQNSCDGERDSYRSHHHHDHWDDDDERAVEFTVYIPDGVKVLAATVNGDVRVSGVSNEVVAESVNGRVEAMTKGGPVQASTVNGTVEARMQTLAGAVRLDYQSVNGSVNVLLPADLKADVDLSTTNGSVRSDFPIAVSGSIDPRHLRGTIGGGGVQLRIETVNGSIELRKAT